MIAICKRLEDESAETTSQEAATSPRHLGLQT